MKQLTMTKVLTPLAALAFAFGVQAAAVSTDGFETETSTVVTNRTGWSFTYGTDGADDASAITAYGQAATPATHDGTTAGSNYLKLSTEDGMLFRNMDGAGGGTVQLDAGLYVDTDVQFTITDPSDRPEVTGGVNGDKFIIWLEANGADTNLCAWAGYYDASGNLSSNVYSLVDSAESGQIVIAPNSWHRLTVKAVANVNAGGAATIPGFQVYVDGHLFKTSENFAHSDYVSALGSEAQDLLTAMTFLPSMTAMESLSKVGFSGEGALDNVVVTKEVPGFEGPVELTFDWDDDAPFTSVALTGLGLTLTSTGTVRVASSLVNQATPLVIAGTNLSNYDVKIDDVPVANPAAASITVANKTYRISATAKDTVLVAFTIDTDSWLEEVEGNALYTYIQSVKVGDEDITATVTGGTAAEIPLKVGTNVTVAVTLSSPVAAASLAPTGADELTISGLNVTVNSFGDGTANIAIVANTPKAFVNGQPYGSFADALSAAATAGTATIALAADATVGDAAIAAGKDITIDLAGNDITGAANAAAVFSVADGGTLTITNSTVTVGVVSKGDATACISNAGTLNLQAGKFDIANGAISGGTINVTGGAYNADTFTGATLPEGKILVQNTGAQDAYAYELGDAPVVQIVGGSTYTSLQAAIDDATAGDTLIVLKNCAIDTSVSIAKNLTISNDYIIAANVNYAICIGATVTFEGSGMIQRGASISGSAFCVGANETTRGAITAGTAGTLIFNGGTICGGNGGNQIKLENGTVEMNGGVLKDGLRGIKADADAGSYTSAIVINGGTITNCSAYAVFASAESATGTATITINGGTIAGVIGKAGKTGTETITIPGTSTARFDANQTAFCESGYETVLSDGWYVVQAVQASGWVDDPTTIPANTSVATQYPDLASSVLATADAKEVTEWAATNNVAFADVAAATSGTTYSNAFLLNCAPTAQAVEDETAAFKATITVAADGTVTVSAPEGKKYNGTLQLKGKAALTDAEWTNVNAPSSSYKFYKYVLSF